MKTKLFIICFLAASLFKAQLNLDYTYNAPSADSRLSLITLASGQKYMLQNNTTGLVRLYNTDHSLWKTIPLTVPAGYTLTNISNVSEKLFNTNDAVEIAYTLLFIDVTGSVITILSQSRIIDEDGQFLIQLPNCSSLSFHNTDNGYKMLARIDSINVRSARRFQVYSLVGSMPMIVPSNELNPVDASLSVYPNPSSERVNIDYTLPEGEHTGQLIMFDVNGNEVKRYTIDNTFNSLELSNGDLPSGTYFYRVVSGNYSTTNKVVIFK